VSETLVLVFARAAGLVFRAPGFAHPSVPPPLRAAFALLLALVIAPQVRTVPHLGTALLVIAAAAEVALGAALGLGAAVLYDAAYAAGRMLDDYVGIRGSVPTANVTSAQGFGRLWSATFLAGLFLLDGYVPIVHAFAGSFARVAPGVAVTAEGWLGFALALPRTFLEAAVLIAAPAIGAAAAVQIALAAIARVVPRFGSFALGFPATFAVVLAATVVAIPLVAPAAARPWLVLPFGAGR
jgi:flagellar biosynthesis protein FliR